MHLGDNELVERLRLEIGLKRGYSDSLVGTLSVPRLKEIAENLGYRVDVISNSGEPYETEEGLLSKVPKNLTLVRIFFGENRELSKLWKAVIS